MDDRWGGAQWLPSPNFGYPDGRAGRQGLKIQGIVFHRAEGDWEAALATLRDPEPPGGPDARVSAHLLVGKSGNAAQLVNFNDASWSNGIIDHPIDLPSWYLDGANPNLRTLSVETEGTHAEPLTEPQTATISRFLLWAMPQLALPPSYNILLGHYRFDSVNRLNCPGPLFPWGRLVYEATPTWDLRASREYRAYAPQTGQWPEAAANLKGVADDALAAGRQLAAACPEHAAIWGTR